MDAECHPDEADVHFILYFTHQDASPARCCSRFFRLSGGTLSFRRFGLGPEWLQEVRDIYIGRSQCEFIVLEAWSYQNSRKNTMKSERL